MKKWLIIPGFILLVVTTVWAYDFTHTGAEIDQGVEVGLNVGAVAGIIESDGADGISAKTITTTIAEPGVDTKIISEKAVVDYINATETGVDNVGANAGTGAGKVYRDKSGITLNFKSIKAGANIVVTNNADDIEISTAGTVGEANVAANVGTGDGTVYRDKTGVTLNFKRLQAGANITLTNNASEIIIASTASGSGDLSGPTPPTVAGRVAVWTDTTALVLKEVPVAIDDSGNMTGVGGIDQAASATPQWVFKDSDAPGTDKDIGGVYGNFLSGGDGAENSETGLQVRLGGALQKVNSFLNLGALANTEFRGDFISGFNCGANLAVGQLVALQDHANPWIVAATATAAPAVGISVTACTSGGLATIMVKGGYRNTTTFSAYTIGNPVFLGAAGAPTATEPATSGDTIQIIGWVYPSSIVYLDFSRPYSTVE